MPEFEIHVGGVAAIVFMVLFGLALPKLRVAKPIGYAEHFLRCHPILLGLVSAFIYGSGFYVFGFLFMEGYHVLERLPDYIMVGAILGLSMGAFDAIGQHLRNRHRVKLRDSQMKFPLLAIALLLTACTDENTSRIVADPADAIVVALNAHCGKAYEGRVVSTDEVDAGFAAERLVMHVRTCTDNALRIPFHVGDDHSRTWVVTRMENGLRLKHDHRHEDGSEDAVTQYGGDSALIFDGRAEFPVDQFSIEMFKREGLTASVTNVWAMEITNKIFAYELSRENRFFRVEFDLENPVTTPPAPWGAED